MKHNSTTALKSCVTCVFATSAILISSSINAEALFTPLGDLIGTVSSSEAYDVSADGTIVTGIGYNSEAFIWTETGGMTGLGKLSPNNFSIGLGVSDDGGTVVGNNAPNDSSTQDAGFIWTALDGMQLLTSEFDRANDVSADGTVIVGRDNIGRQAFRWTEAGGVVGLGVLIPGSSSHSEALAVSDDGSTVVGVSYYNDLVGYPRTGEAVMWTPTGGIIGLGDFAGGYNNSLSYANAISADKSAVVGRGEDAFGYVAFRWTEATGLVNLGTLPAANYFSEAFGVSGDGAIVVGTSGLFGDTAAFIWDDMNGMRDLKTVLQQEYGLSLKNWTLKAATRITPDGNVIVGYGTNPQGKREAWRVILDTTLADIDLAITGTGTASVNQGDTATFDFVLINNTAGSEQVQSAVVNYSAPAFVQITGVTASSGTCVTSGSSASCNLGNLLPSASVSMTVTAVGWAAGDAFIAADASATGNELTPADNQTSVSYTVLGIPEVEILSPTDGSTFLIGDTVSLQATATDLEDGDVSFSLQWHSSLDGDIGTGPVVFTGNLGPGDHAITATATDSSAAPGSALVNITVTTILNTPPDIVISSPLNNAVYSADETILFQATASDLEDGNIDASINWSSSLDGALGSGGSLTSALTAGSHLITAQVTDSGGESTSRTVSVTVEPAVVSYCASRGNSTSYEWIDGIGIGSFSNNSGNNAGYADFTGSGNIALARGLNSITLSPGFRSGSYNEYWRIWIDYDHDGIFDSNELAYSVGSRSTIYGSIDVPSTAMAGSTRMRVAMRWGGAPSACGTFSYGEVEDYTVGIAP